jgi:uridylate kinase
MTSKKTAKKQPIIVVSLGGSVVYPYAEGRNNGLDVPFLKEFRQFVLGQAKKGKRFIVVVGGGRPCRMYQKAVREVLGEKKNNLDLDWIGIQSTKTNALFMAKILKEVSFPRILDHEPGKKEIGAFLNSNKKLLMVSGWQPGWSTDYDAIQCAIFFKQKEVYVAGDSPYVCDKDPRKFPDAKPIMDLTWAEYQKLIPAKWIPGLSAPVDPAGAKAAKKAGLTAKLLKGTDIENFKKAIEGEPFDGSTIHI